MSRYAWQAYCENCGWVGQTIPVADLKNVHPEESKSLKELAQHIQERDCLNSVSGAWGTELQLVGGTAAERKQPDAPRTGNVKVTHKKGLS